jgi:hypothetical protein
MFISLCLSDQVNLSCQPFEQVSQPVSHFMVRVGKTVAFRNQSPLQFVN